MMDQRDRPICNGFICEYTCNEFAEEFQLQSSDMRRFVVNYDYEMYVSVDSVLNDALHKTESRFLSVASSMLGLDECDPIARQSQFQFGDDHNWMYNDINVGPNKAAIASLGSVPFDKIDGEKATCTQKLSEKQEGSTCIPIHGSIAVGYYGDKSFEHQISKSVLNHLERGASYDWYITGDDEVQKIVLVKEVLESEVTPTTPALSTSSISLIIVLVASMIIGAAFLARRTFTKRNSDMLFVTPSPKAGKKSGLRAHDSECIRVNLNDNSYDLNISRSGSVDPFESESQEDETPSILLETQLNAYKNTILSTITEGSKENSSNGNRISVMSSPTVTGDFNRILSESTYSDGVHSLGRSIDEYTELGNNDDGNDNESDLLYGIGLPLNTPPQDKHNGGYTYV